MQRFVEGKPIITGQAIPEYMASLVATSWFWKRLRDLSRGVGGRRERVRPEKFLELELETLVALE